MPLVIEKDGRPRAGIFRPLLRGIGFFLQVTLMRIIGVVLGLYIVGFSIDQTKVWERLAAVLDYTELDLHWWEMDSVLSDGESNIQGEGWRELSFLLPEGYRGLDRCGKAPFGKVMEIRFARPSEKTVKGCWSEVGVLLTDRMLILTRFRYADQRG